jgi:hypothetical protein
LGRLAITNRYRVLGAIVGAILAVAASAPQGISPATAAAPVSNLRIVNYFAAGHPEGNFWSSDWDVSSINADLATIAALHANTVRVFVPACSNVFGYPLPSPYYTAELRDLVTMASNQGLGVYLNLFNWDNCQHYADIVGSERWAQGVLDSLPANIPLAAIEVKNEIDPTNPVAVAWATAMISYLHTHDPGNAVAISPMTGTQSCGGWCPIQLLSELHRELGNAPDFYSYHYYNKDVTNDPTATAQQYFQKAVAAVAPSRLIVGEAGFGTAMKAFGLYSSRAGSQLERDQATFFGAVYTAARNTGIAPPGVWNLFDVGATPGASFISDDYFGVFRANKSAKPAVDVIAAGFAS